MKYSIANLFIAFVILNSGTDSVFASPVWTIYDDDTGAKVTFTLDPKKEFVDGEKNMRLFGKTLSCEKSKKGILGIRPVPSEVEKLLWPILALNNEAPAATDSQRLEFNASIVKISFDLAGVKDFDHLRILTRIKTVTKGDLHVLPTPRSTFSGTEWNSFTKIGDKVITRMAIFSTKMHGYMPGNCMFPIPGPTSFSMKTYPMGDRETFVDYVNWCYGQLHFMQTNRLDLAIDNKTPWEISKALTVLGFYDEAKAVLP